MSFLLLKTHLTILCSLKSAPFCICKFQVDEFLIQACEFIYPTLYTYIILYYIRLFQKVLLFYTEIIDARCFLFYIIL